ncbi:hypothetical protein [Flexistipes sinusarabici]|nr:hypothetical protein [Flexistipes sinusarabici]
MKSKVDNVEIACLVKYEIHFTGVDVVDYVFPFEILGLSFKAQGLSYGEF